MPKIAVLFLILFSTGIVLPFVLYPLYSFYLYQAIYFINPANQWWTSDIPGIPYSFVAGVLVIISFLISKKSDRTPKISEVKVFKLIYFILFYYVFMYFFAINKTMHFQATFESLKLVLIISLVFKLIDSLKKLENVLYIYIAGCFYLAFEAFSSGRNMYGRLESVTTADATDSNLIASVIVPSIPIIIYFFFHSEKFKKYSVVIFSAFIVNSLILLNSRGAFLGVISGSSFYFYFLLKGGEGFKSKRFMVLLVLVMASIAAFSLTDKVFWQRMATITEQKTNISEGELSGGSTRILFWVTTFKMLNDYPMGLGAWGFETLSPLYLDEKYLSGAGEVKARSVHSSWFQSLGELGWPGPVLYFMLIILAFKVSSKIKQKALKNNDDKMYFMSIALSASLISFLVTGIFINRFRSEIFYWLIMFMASAYWLYMGRENSSSKKTINHQGDSN